METTASLKAFLVAGFAAGEAAKFVNACSPLMYELKNTDADVHMIVDGHAWDAAALDAIAEEIAAAASSITVTEGSTITVA